ncbi:hypothetical protein [Sphingomonas sp. NFX23]|uniref:hypothetical protein n=1 Tax=Sphingomonas sp. NFX23 TaxID=2819532 RepID=UPI003CEBA188
MLCRASTSGIAREPEVAFLDRGTPVGEDRVNVDGSPVSVDRRELPVGSAEPRS